MSTYHLHLRGQVQGVGFRPFVYRQARAAGLCGWVSNTLDGVHVEINAGREGAERFLEQLVREAPPLAVVTGWTLREAPEQLFDAFRIIHSENGGAADLLLTPDFGICEDCRRELANPGDRRFGYPFITCTNCGPRFSIIRKLPYDREHTTMDPFRMCPSCLAEYQWPEDRRYYSQTNSCPACPVRLHLFDAGGQWGETGQEAIIGEAARRLREGQIGAIKGIGGYLLVCDATRGEVVRLLRKRKHRPFKPFALMYPDMDMLEQDAALRPVEKEALMSPTAPIVLLVPRAAPASGLALPEVAPDLGHIGVMLPYTPLFELLLRQLRRPLVATSGNLSHSPIIFQDEKALEEFSQVADFVLTNDREIAVPQDDSVVQYSGEYAQRIVLRRSRGLAPTFLLPGWTAPESCILATGAMLKSTFALTIRRNLYLSQYLGDLESFDTQQHYELVLQHLIQVFDCWPQRIIVDQHPDYFSTQLGKRLADTLRVPLESVQHHEAHFGAVLAENGLLETADPVLGVIWDGTGLGEDGQIWGGEFFRFENGSISREGHWEYFPFILGDKMPREPRISALAAAGNLKEARPFLQKKFSPAEWQLYRQMLRRKPVLQTSSMGRMFDAVAALLGLRDKVSFEGEAAMVLEQCARRYFDRHGLGAIRAYPLPGEGWQLSGRLPTGSLMSSILGDLRRGLAVTEISAKFIFSLVDWTGRFAGSRQIRRLAFSGGVFQNALLVDLFRYHLGENAELFFHRQLSPNDESVAFGQVVCHQLRQ